MTSGTWTSARDGGAVERPSRRRLGRPDILPDVADGDGAAAAQGVGEAAADRFQPMPAGDAGHPAVIPVPLDDRDSARTLDVGIGHLGCPDLPGDLVAGGVQKRPRVAQPSEPRFEP